MEDYKKEEMDFIVSRINSLTNGTIEDENYIVSLISQLPSVVRKLIFSLVKDVKAHRKNVAEQLVLSLEDLEAQDARNVQRILEKLAPGEDELLWMKIKQKVRLTPAEGRRLNYLINEAI